jgi:hypothetical protein
VRAAGMKVVVVMAVAAFLVGGSSAQAGGRDGAIEDASARAAGLTTAELLREELRQVLELPLDANPAAGNGNNCLWAGHRQKVLIVWTTGAPAPVPVCRVKPGTPVFFYVLGGECSSVEAPPWFGRTEREQRNCMLRFLRTTPFDAILVGIDDRPGVSIASDRFLTVSRQGAAFLPDPNIFGVPGNRRATFVAAGYTALIRSLRPGSHTITATIAGGPYAGQSRAVVEVVRGHDS